MASDSTHSLDSAHATIAHPLAFKTINTLRGLAIDAIEKSKSGHPGLPLGAAPMGYVLWQHHLKHAPAQPTWPDRDRFVLSAGHGSMLLYCLLHMSGYDLSLEDLTQFRQWKSKTPGHPEFGLTPGVDATTGPLGQGTANAVGMAIAERFLAHTFNKPDFTLFDHYTYALVSDGDMMEGLSAEAASLAGHLKLGKLIYLYDANDISLDGPTSLTFTEDVAKRYESYGWQVLVVHDGNKDLDAIHTALQQAKSDTTKPSLIIINTTIGYGSPSKQGTSSCHGSPLGPDESRKTKQALGLNPDDSFVFPQDVQDHTHTQRTRGDVLLQNWTSLLADYEKAYPTDAALLHEALRSSTPHPWEKILPVFQKDTSIATRDASHTIINALAKNCAYFLGGDADLSCSTMTKINNEDNFNGLTGSGRNIRYGVREHAMGAILNGMLYHGGVRSFAGTFFVFSDYMKPAIRLAALNHLPAIYVFTHDSIGVGEDGPTHQPIEHLAALRAMPNMMTMRPADANETAMAWRFAMEHTTGPTALVLSRQKLPVLDRIDSRTGSYEGVLKGAYIVRDTCDAQTIFALVIATGSEVHAALDAQKILEEKHHVYVRVVSMPCMELFAQQDPAYREHVLPHSVSKRVSIEAASTFGWSHYTGPKGTTLGLNHFGASAPGDVLFREFSIHAEAVVQAVLTLKLEAKGALAVEHLKAYSSN